ILVREIRNRDKVIENYRPEPLVENIVSPRTLKWTSEIMKGTVDSGTALLFVRSPKVKIAGKTGTAVLEKTEDGKKYQASFAGYFPADNPKYSCIVVVQEPQGDLVYGAQVAGPVFKEIAEGIHSLDMDLEEIDYAAKRADYTNRPTFLKAKTSDYLPMYQSLGLATDKGQSTAQWSEPMAGDGKIVVRAKPDEAHLIPDLKGLSLSDALYICENAGLRVKYEGSGTVYRQVPEKRTSYSPGKTIYINLR
ncbi:MAG: PASTA domain-containing protein, partial [Bacteroidetes bacterium]|nr:PASTA domain-containing protein [Bacteroidota bacterium]